MGSKLSLSIQEFSHIITEASKTIKIKTSKEILNNLTKPREIVSHINKNFSNIYILEVEPRNIERYKSYPDIYKLLIQYIKRAENRPLQFMFLKHTEDNIIQSKINFKTLQNKFGNDIQFDNITHYLVVGAFGGSTPRENSEIINIIKANSDLFIIE